MSDWRAEAWAEFDRVPSFLPEPRWRRSRCAYRRARFRFGMRLGNRDPLYRLAVALGYPSPSVGAMLGPMPPRFLRLRRWLGLSSPSGRW